MVTIGCTPEDKKIEHSPKAQEILSQQTITSDGPGTILKDFNQFLAFIDFNGTKVSGKYDLLPIKTLPIINSQLSNPPDIRLKRPRQVSYPHINGLYLLARGTGVTMIDRNKLCLNEPVFERWQALNPTEQYFTLFEAWLYHCPIDIIGLPENRTLSGFVSQALSWFFQNIQKQGFRFVDIQDQIRYTLKWHNLALTELFGLVLIKPARPVDGEGWQIKHIYSSPFGQALHEVVVKYYTHNHYKLLRMFLSDDPTGIPIGCLQSTIQPYFSDWQTLLTLPQPEFQPGTYTFKVSLGRAWRRVQLLAQMDLDALSDIILSVFDFDNNHLYYFTYNDHVGRQRAVNHPDFDEGPWTDEIEIGNLSLKLGQTMTFMYDMGSSWRFKIRLEAIEPPIDLIVPILLDSYGQAPERYPEYSEW